MEIFFAADHAGFELKNQLISWLAEFYPSFAVRDLSPTLVEGDDYPVQAVKLANQLSTKDSAIGVAVCGSGLGINIALNRYSFIRAVCVSEVQMAKLSRLHNNANVLCLPARYLDSNIGQKIVETFLHTEFSQESRHIRRVKQLSKLPVSL